MRLPVLLLLAAVPVVASTHHGISNWDLNRDISLTGRLARIELINPHSWIHLEVRGADGRVASWKCEMRSVNSQRQLAVAKDRAPARRALRTADGRPNLAGDWAAEQRVMSDPRGQLGTLVLLSQARNMRPGELPAGQAAFPGARGSAASLAADPVAAAWDRPIPARLTDKGREALRDFNPASRDNPRLRCEPTSILFDWTFDSVVNRIEQTPSRITLRYGHMDLERIIHMNGRARPPGTRASRSGYSVGRWDGEVLVVETSGFLPGVLNADSRILHGSGLRIVERFELDAAGLRLTRTSVAEDPEYFADSLRSADVVLPADVAHEPYSCRDPGGAPAAR